MWSCVCSGGTLVPRGGWLSLQTVASHISAKTGSCRGKVPLERMHLLATVAAAL